MDYKNFKNANIDLHSHTICSDGLLTPFELVSRAASNNVNLLSITDHDTLNAYTTETLTMARDLNVCLVSGCEISASWNDLPFIHILVYDFDLENSTLKNEIENLQKKRYEIAVETNKSLVNSGLPSILDEVLDSVKNNYNMLFRKSFANILVKKGICSTIEDAKEKYFKPGKPGFVNASFPTILEIIDWAKKSNAKTVLAHPGEYHLNKNTTLLDYFRNSGGDAIEVFSGSHSSEQINYYHSYCQIHDFPISIGSDFHSKDYKGIDIGKCFFTSDRKKIWETFNNLDWK